MFYFNFFLAIWNSPNNHPDCYAISYGSFHAIIFLMFILK